MSLRAALRWSVTIVGEDDEAVFKASSERLQVLFGAFSAEDDDAARLPQTIQLLSVEKTMEKKKQKETARSLGHEVQVKTEETCTFVRARICLPAFFAGLCVH